MGGCRHGVLRGAEKGGGAVRIQPDGVDRVKRHEAFREFAYPDTESDIARGVRAAKLKVRWGFMPANQIIQTLPPELRVLSGTPWTCGYGETQDVTPETRWGREEANQRLRLRVGWFEAQVLSGCRRDPNLNQLTAMTCLAYNIGVAAFKSSTVLRAHNAGDFAAAARAFHLFNKSRGRVITGLVNRRADEAALYARPVPDEMSDGAEDLADPPPQSVDPESSMAASPINRSAVVAGGTAAVGAVAETARTVADVKYSLSSLGDWLLPVLLVAVVGLCGFIVWERVRQRRGGWA